MPVVLVRRSVDSERRLRPRQQLAAQRRTDSCRKRGINMAKILIPTPLRQFAEKHDHVEFPGATVGEVLGALTAKYPDLKKHLYNDEGKLRSFVNVYLNDEDIRYMNKEATPAGAADTLSIVPSIAGGTVYGG